jgi:ADP-ribose pyrophosphatase YjhB (NUDIX family)
MRNRAAALIIKNGTLLLIRRQKPGQDYYILPGGGVELDESFEDACIREVKEETGLDVLGIQRVHTYNYRGSEEVYFLTRVPTDDPVLGGSEATRQSPANQYSFEWVSPEQLEGKNLQPPPARRICLEILRKQNG